MSSLGLTKIRTGCKIKDKDHMEFLCELFEAQVARGHYFVHELMSAANSRLECVPKIMAMSGTIPTMADLCMFGLASRAEGGPGFASASVRTVTNLR